MEPPTSATTEGGWQMAEADPLVTGVDDSTSLTLTLALAAYVGVSLTIPFWVPIVKRLSGDCGLFWVSHALRTRERPCESHKLTPSTTPPAGLLRPHLLRIPRVAHLCAASGAAPLPRATARHGVGGDRRGAVGAVRAPGRTHARLLARARCD